MLEQPMATPVGVAAGLPERMEVQKGPTEECSIARRQLSMLQTGAGVGKAVAVRQEQALEMRGAPEQAEA